MSNNKERIDDIGFANLRLIQRPEEFCYGIDAVLLSSFARVKKQGRVIDLGTGTGIIPIILSHKTEAREIVGIEIQPSSYQLALRNISINNLENKLKMINLDVKNIGDGGISETLTSILGKGSFDAVTSNPPYVKGRGGLKNKNEAKTIARHETTASLEDFIKSASWLLKDKGDFFLVHRPDRLVDICVLCRENNLEPKKIRFVSPSREKGPNILLVHCVKYGNPELKFLDPLYVYNENGEYTQEIMEIYERKVSDTSS